MAIPSEVWKTVSARRAALPEPGIRRAIRVSAGFTQGELARVLGVARSTITRYETGSRSPRGSARMRYSELLRELRRHG